ncbi:homocysteine S-methyltransferase family protein [uncultured Gemmiger sp.]|uniref:homocysteine S-methyltransferase family protein n=1 Tax=uncultured Gemmiger sp. TaxID=1623490 RepID=UPI0025DFC548|nr:homocysteine S-methyltransferase family protein [uncultured Gemmiger sp.]
MQCNELFDRRQFVFLDGAMGTQLTARGLQPGQMPELAALTCPEILTAIHRDYANAGADLLLANTFGANPRKLAGTGHTVEEVITASIACARTAAGQTGSLVALDIGPIGELLAPAGSLAFEDAVTQFAQMVEAGTNAGADLVFLETMTDLYELKAGILAAKEHSNLPVFASMSFEANGRTFTGCTVESFAATAVGLGVDAIGINCSLGPAEILPLIQRLCRLVPAGLPVFVKANAGLPNPDGSYNLTPADFAQEMLAYLPTGISMAGGCCGTTPQTIRLLRQAFAGHTPAQKIPLRRSVLCTPVRCVEVDGITVVGERINPTGKKRLQQALRTGDTAYPASQAVAQAEVGAQVLDVNVGLPGIDEAATLEHLVRELQSITDLPLQLDSSNPEALARALRIYNGKPIVNSVNGEQKTLDAILPLCKKYGAAVVGLTMDEHGIPKTAAERVAIARHITGEAGRYGIPPEDVYIDCLTLTASAQQEGAAETLKALTICKRELGVRTVLGVSNISFGLPCRGYLNATFLTMAMAAGLDLAIINPNTPDMMGAVRAFRVLTGSDRGSTDYIRAYADVQIQTTQTVKTATVATSAQPEGEHTLADAVRCGLKAEARAAAKAALANTAPLDLVNQVLIPALDAVGNGFEKGSIFLPQLLQSASAAQAAFEEVKSAIAASGTQGESRGRIVIATVKGDVHDIGKNIVRVILENYGYEVIDLGRDVPPETVVETVRRTGAPLVGLSALMTTTVPAMQDTIAALHAAGLPCQVMVGGAVLTPDYARQIGADFYAKDAKAAADIAKQVFHT